MGQRTKTRMALLGITILLGSMLAVAPAAAQNEPPLTVTKTGPATAVVGEELTFTVSVTNNGSVAATNVVMTDYPNSETNFARIDAPGGWSCTTPAVGSWGTIICSLAGSFAPGDTATFSVVLTAAVVGGSKNAALVEADGHDDGYDSLDFTIGAVAAPTPTPAPTATPAPTGEPAPTVEPAPTATAGPTTEPTTRPEPTPTADAGTSPGGGNADGDVGSGGAAAPDGASLPATGSDATTMSILALVAIAAGALLVTGGLVLRPQALAATARHARSVTGRRSRDPR